jgi:hypothetical protein
VRDVPFAEAAIFWFGKVSSPTNYSDVRIGYNDRELYVYVATFDRFLWYDPNPSPANLEKWDALTLCLAMGEGGADSPSTNSYRFVSQVNAGDLGREPWQTVYRGDGMSWAATTVPFSTTSGWRGNALNDTRDDRGWATAFSIPFSSLGLDGPPSQGTLWGLSLIQHDRDDAVGTVIPNQTWPSQADENKPYTWGQLRFGVPSYLPPAVTSQGSVEIRQGLNGQDVPDADVGGTTSNPCRGDSDYIWTEWGEANWGSAPDFNIQNQSDVADWPCFAKYYIKFPLDSVPSGKKIVSATLTLHQFGGSGNPNSKPDDSDHAFPSMIQVSTTSANWDVNQISWNNAPLANENICGSWVEATTFTGWPGVARDWDVSRAVTQAYETGQPLSLVLYEADDHYHSGKHFVSSDTGVWNVAGRPMLYVTYGD